MPFPQLALSEAPPMRTPLLPVGVMVLLVFALTVPAAPPLQNTGGKATPAERLKVAKDFKIELVYSVPRDKEGSWVSMCALPDGRLIVSDQGGAGLFRVTPPPLGGSAADTKVEKLPAAISGAQGLLWAFDSL